MSRGEGMAVTQRPPAWRRLVSQWFDLPQDVVMDLPRISIIGDLQLLVQNHRGVMAYRDDRVVVAMQQGRLIISGEGLMIGVINDDELTIAGQLARIEFGR